MTDRVVFALSVLAGAALAVVLTIRVVIRVVIRTPVTAA